MFSRFIVATDLSQASFALVNSIGGLRASGSQHCLLLQCLSLQEVGSVASAYTTDKIDRVREEQKKILEKQGFTVEERIVPGFVQQEINRLANVYDCSLIVVGSQEHSMVAEAFLCGVTSDIIHNARRPVLVVRLEKKKEGANLCIQASRCDLSGHVLFPTDFSENADIAFLFLKEIVSEGSAHVTLLHVQDKVRIAPHLKHMLDEFNKIDRERLEKMKANLEEKGNVHVHIELVYGAPYTEIIRVIREKQVNLVLMGSQGRGFVKELFLGSVSHNVARNSEASVLLIPFLPPPE